MPPDRHNRQLQHRQLRQQAVLLAVLAAILATMEAINMAEKIPYHTSQLSGQQWLLELVNSPNPHRLKEQLGVNWHVYLSLVNQLSDLTLLEDSRSVTCMSRLLYFFTLLQAIIPLVVLLSASNILLKPFLTMWTLSPRRCALHPPIQNMSSSHPTKFHLRFRRIRNSSHSFKTWLLPLMAATLAQHLRQSIALVTVIARAKYRKMCYSAACSTCNSVMYSVDGRAVQTMVWFMMTHVVMTSPFCLANAILQMLAFPIVIRF